MGGYNSMENKKKKNLFITIGLIGALLLVVGITYAYWILTKQQTGGATVLGQIV